MNVSALRPLSQEYRRVAHLLRNSKNSKALFLRCYSLYLAGEKRKDEERIELSGPLGKAQTTNKVTRMLGCFPPSTRSWQR